MHKKGFVWLLPIVVATAVIVAGVAGYLAGKNTGSYPVTRSPAGITELSLPPATVGQHYSVPLWNALAAAPAKDSVLPSGLSIRMIALPCAPPLPGESNACPNEYDLVGVPTRAGMYAFRVEFQNQKTSTVKGYAITVR